MPSGWARAALLGAGGAKGRGVLPMQGTAAMSIRGHR